MSKSHFLWTKIYFNIEMYLWWGDTCHVGTLFEVSPRHRFYCNTCIIDMVVSGHYVKKRSSVSIWNSQKCDRKWFSDIQNGHFVKIFKKKKFRIDLKCPEMRSKVNFGHPKWPIDLKWPEMPSKVILGHPKWPLAAIL